MKRSQFLKLMALGGLGLALESTGSAIVRAARNEDIPSPAREFRGVWVATVANIDWPTRATLTPAEQQAELIAICDLTQSLGMNALVFQVRPSCDAFYRSELEPWSSFLTGEMGRAPAPAYDPLEFAVAEAHKRGLELHAWFNPFRALHPSHRGPVAPNHISMTRPDLAKRYGRYVWMDPGEPDARDHSLRVILDVVKRYDIDAVHFDDYLYPYVERDAQNQALPFPDNESWAKYREIGGTMSRDDWRRSNADTFIRTVGEELKNTKPFVKFGVSPFGIWQPGNPAGVTGLNAFAELYADSRKWLAEGWVDYLAPQLYWPIQPPAQSYTALLDWWIAQNRRGRHLWPGNAAYKIADGSTRPYTTGELLNQIAATRARRGATGNIFFSFNSFRRNVEAVSTRLKGEAYQKPALIPASPWLDAEAPAAPRVRLRPDLSANKLVATWTPRRKSNPWQWVVAFNRNGNWEHAILPGTSRRADLPDGTAEIAVWAVSRTGIEGAKTVIEARATNRLFSAGKR